MGMRRLSSPRQEIPSKSMAMIATTRERRTACIVAKPPKVVDSSRVVRKAINRNAREPSPDFCPSTVKYFLLPKCMPIRADAESA